MTPTPPDKGATPHCPRCGRSVPLYGQWCGDCPPDKDELENIELGTNDFGWTDLLGNYPEAIQAINRLIVKERLDELKRAIRQGYISAPLRHKVDRRIATLEQSLKEQV